MTFAPTYKYTINTPHYVGDELEEDAGTGAETKKRRTPAWCDRILWRGAAVQQLSYGRGEQLFSDHRPVSAAFGVTVDAVVPERLEQTQQRVLAAVRACASRSTVISGAAASVLTRGLQLLRAEGQQLHGQGWGGQGEGAWGDWAADESHSPSFPDSAPGYPSTDEPFDRLPRRADAISEFREPAGHGWAEEQRVRGEERADKFYALRVSCALVTATVPYRTAMLARYCTAW